MVTTKTTPISKIMSLDPITVTPNAKLEHVKIIFETRNIHHIPVVEQEKVVGILSKGDYFKVQHYFTLFDLPQSRIFNEELFSTLLVKDIMRKQVVTLSKDDDIGQAVAIFRDNLFHSIPIVDKNNKILGIITTYDLLKYAYDR